MKASVAAVLVVLSLGARALAQATDKPAVNPAPTKAPASAPSPAAGARMPRQPSELALKVGDPAPALKVHDWVKGNPVESFEKGTAYVCEFGASWCEPCRKCVPHLSELQHKYKDSVRVI